ncbi:protein PHOTOSYSTEM I ASSEMBLY 2, chloroplastic [Gastrolobium bilobum]|uniref:protein PHOTOSYSTEM I ASSEMBLY 2, chloroplastic n=1 Tax=Gastrolobium bilobum TaxID=150636 RepID=UPI002AB2ACAE|nr:protein PHOTOSYSTEM I ASSEMBLY 2, chloroplastic [Gastrolobium bilobum]XP_061356766.1 protein PHOTOSYSTEM I ASSEMBLY 2, chloroplastic [Gastrolobium bilobum]XP_061356767.1 protein PHOTOSYSTEM I ASSEMBLY 2, chloroplastic [Gastrolobium bilobum]
MDSATLQMATSKFVLCPNASAVKVSSLKKTLNFGSNFKVHALPPNGSASSYTSRRSVSSLKADENRKRSNLESLFCYDKAIPEERIEKPVGLSLAEKAIGNNPRCTDCQAKGAILCATCAGSGLYVDSILESQGIIVKVRCLGCGGTGNMMCTECGGRGHL